MGVVVLLGLVSSVLNQEIGWNECLQDYLFHAELVVKA